ncbi:MAG: helix-turn-helix domain-containing protein [Cellulosilyticum sp.]|nr:helix-turn-helix domain-containing protein [Cellulosilyticum sp.]
MFNDHLQQTMENFFLCTHLPLRAFNEDLEEVLSTGLVPGMTAYHKEVQNWLCSLKSLTNLNAQHTFSPRAHVYFTLCSLGAYLGNTASSQSAYFLIGPYTDDLSLKEDFAFKPQHCMPHLIELLYAISESHATTAATVALNDYNYHTHKAQQYIKEHFAEPITLDILAHHLDLNKSYLCTIFKQATKESFCTYTNKVRIEESKKLLKNTTHSMTDIALLVGFSSASYFNTMFKKLEGKTPLEYRKESDYPNLPKNMTSINAFQ